MSSSQRPPAYLLHKPSGQARVRVNGKDYYLGPHGSAESKDRYDDLIHKWRLQAVGDESHLVTVDDLALAYLEYAKGHYLKGGRETSDVCCIRNALRFLVAAAGRLPRRSFGPKLLKEIRQRMIAEGHCRTTINKNIGRIRRTFRWGVAEELVPATVLMSLQSVDGLRAGRCAAVEPEPVRPVAQYAVDAIKPFVSRPVWAMVQLQLITGMRSGEVVAMRAADLGMSGAIWEYRPRSHKTEHHGKQRVVFLGPRGSCPFDNGALCNRGPLCASVGSKRWACVLVVSGTGAEQQRMFSPTEMVRNTTGNAHNDGDRESSDQIQFIGTPTHACQFTTSAKKMPADHRSVRLIQSARVAPAGSVIVLDDVAGANKETRRCIRCRLVTPCHPSVGTKASAGACSVAIVESGWQCE